MQEKGKLVARGPCEGCGQIVAYRLTARGRLYYTCALPIDGGCGKQVFNRSDKSDEMLWQKRKETIDPAFGARRFPELNLNQKPSSSTLKPKQKSKAKPETKSEPEPTLPPEAKPKPAKAWLDL